MLNFISCGRKDERAIIYQVEQDREQMDEVGPFEGLLFDRCPHVQVGQDNMQEPKQVAQAVEVREKQN